MQDSSASEVHDGVERPARWLVLFHQLPPKPAYLRVKVRRRLNRIGAVALKNAVYLLPLAPDTLEDFQWLRREIVDWGGEATLCASELIEGLDDAEAEALFRQRCDAEYIQVLEAAQALGGKPSEQAVARLRRQLRQTVQRDYFETPGRAAAEQALAALETRRAGRGQAQAGVTKQAADRPRGAVWVTRRDVHVDRLASAWLITRFIDPAAQFKFVPAVGYAPQPGELRFDMFEGEYTHEADRCTFETFLARFGLDDPALGAIAEIVHEIDCKDEKFSREETEGIRTVVEGIALGHRDDRSRLEAGRAVFDGLYEHFHRGV